MQNPTSLQIALGAIRGLLEVGALLLVGLSGVLGKAALAGSGGPVDPWALVSNSCKCDVFGLILMCAVCLVSLDVGILLILLPTAPAEGTLRCAPCRGRFG